MSIQTIGIKIWGDLKDLTTALSKGRSDVNDFSKQAAGAFKDLSKDVKNAEQTAKDLTKTYGKFSPAAVEATAKAQALRNELNEINSSVKGGAGVFSELKTNLGAIGLTAGAFAGALEFGKGVINSTDATADKFEETITGLKFAYDSFMRSIATGDFSVLLKSMTDAISVGKEYAATLDEVEERTNSLNIIEGEYKNKIQDELKIMRDKRQSDSERANAAVRAMKLEGELLDKKESLANTNFKNELKRAAFETGLQEATVAAYLRNRDANNQLIQASSKYLDLLKEKASWEAKDSRDQQKAAELTRINTELQNVDTTTKVYATEVVAKMGKTTQEQMTKTSAAWRALYDVQLDFKEGTRKTWSTYTGLMKDMAADGVKKAKSEWAEFAKTLKEANAEGLKWKQTVDSVGMGTDSGGMSGKINIPYKASDGGNGEVDMAGAKMPSFLTSKAPGTNFKDLISQLNELKSTMSGLGGTASALFGSIADGWLKISDNLKAVTGDWKETFKNIFSAIGDIASKAVGFITDLFTQQNTNRLNQLDTYYTAEKDRIENSTASETEKKKRLDKLNKDTEKERKRLIREQAKDQKTASLIQAVIAGALAVVQSLAMGGVIGIVLAAIVGALAAVQIATIASQPLPALAKGGLAYGPTMALVGDNANANINPEVIAPLNTLKNMLDGGTQQVEVFGVLRGNDIMISNERASTYRTRTRGY